MEETAWNASVLHYRLFFFILFYETLQW
jgi:hypothetical protein